MGELTMRDIDKSPCMGCEEREQGCHSHCVAYRKWAAEKRQDNNKKKWSEMAHAILRGTY